MARMIERTINWTISFLWSTTGLTLRIAWRIFAILILPVLRRMINFILRWMIFTVLSTIRGPRMATDLVAEDWTDGVLGVGVPIAFASNLYPAFKVGAYLLLISGWVFMMGVGFITWSLLIDYIW